jgi:hypothetical protein
MRRNNKKDRFPPDEERFLSLEEIGIRQGRAPASIRRDFERLDISPFHFGHRTIRWRFSDVLKLEAQANWPLCTSRFMSAGIAIRNNLDLYRAVQASNWAYQQLILIKRQALEKLDPKSHEQFLSVLKAIQELAMAHLSTIEEIEKYRWNNFPRMRPRRSRVKTGAMEAPNTTQ